MCKIWNGLVEPFYSDDETYIQTDRDYNFIYIDIPCKLDKIMNLYYYLNNPD